MSILTRAPAPPPADGRSPDALAAPERTARHAHILATAARELTRHVSPAALYAGLTDVATSMLGARRVTVVLADPETRHVEVAHTGGTGADAGDGRLRCFWHGELGAAVTAARPRFLLADELAPAHLDDGETGGVALLPLVVEGRPRGLLVLRFAAAPSFDDEERRLLADFATQVAVALRNAALVAALERRAARLAAVADVQQALPQSRLVDVYAALHRIVRSVVDVSGFGIFLCDEETGAFRAGHVVVDGRPLDPAALGPCPARDAIAEAVRATGEPVLDRHPLWSLAAAAPPEPGREWHPAASGLAAPIVHGARVLGVLHVQSLRADAYTDDDADLVGLVARQAGAAVELAHLFDAQRHERELAEAAATVARVALATDGVRPAAAGLLAAVAAVVPQLALTLAVRMDEGAVLEYVAATPTLTHVVGHRLPVEESFVRFLTGDELVCLPDVRAATPPEHRHIAPPLGAVLVPLLARGTVLGLIAVETALDAPPSAATARTLRRLAAPVALAVDALLLGEEERRRMERERLLATALATMDQPVFVLTPDERVRYANAAAGREYGYPLDELTGLPLARLVCAVQDVAVASGDAGWLGADGRRPTRLGGALRVAQQVHRRRDGSEFPAAATLGTLRDGTGAVTGRVMGVRNLTDERRVAEQLRQHEKLAALGSLVAGVAHELNNPLTGISAFSQLLLEEALPDDQLESVRLIKREADRAVGVIRDLLIFARKTDARLDAVDVNALLQLTVRLRAYTLRAEDIAVALELDPAAPCVPGDEQRLQQVLLNLIVNAEYALQGRPDRRLTLRTRRAADHLVVEVTDTGAGIAPDVQPHIFEPFFTTKPAGAGTGLGLSVSYGIVQAHGGTITVQSRPGRGTTFRITLPASSAAPPGAPASA